jgi:hypothetical protein
VVKVTAAQLGLEMHCVLLKCDGRCDRLGHIINKVSVLIRMDTSR